MQGFFDYAETTVQPIQPIKENQNADIVELIPKKEYLELYRRFNENIRLSNSIPTEILKGLQKGETITALFLQAMKCISLMTNNTLTYTESVNFIHSVYGVGLHEPEATALTLEAVNNRLEKLRLSLNTTIDTTNRAHILTAIQQHEQLIQELKAESP